MEASWFFCESLSESSFSKMKKKTFSGHTKHVSSQVAIGAEPLSEWTKMYE